MKREHNLDEVESVDHLDPIDSWSVWRPGYAGYWVTRERKEEAASLRAECVARDLREDYAARAVAPVSDPLVSVVALPKFAGQLRQTTSP